MYDAQKTPFTVYWAYERNCMPSTALLKQEVLGRTSKPTFAHKHMHIPKIINNLLVYCCLCNFGFRMRDALNVVLTNVSANVVAAIFKVGTAVHNYSQFTFPLRKSYQTKFRSVTMFTNKTICFINKL